MAESQDYHDFGEQSELNIMYMCFFSTSRAYYFTICTTRSRKDKKKGNNKLREWHFRVNKSSHKLFIDHLFLA